MRPGFLAGVTLAMATATHPAAGQEAAPVQTGLQGDYLEAFWDKPFDPEGFEDTRFATALTMIVPNVRSYRIESAPDLLQRRVRLPKNATRREALRSVALQAGLVVTKAGGKMSITTPPPVVLSVEAEPTAQAQTPQEPVPHQASFDAPEPQPTTQTATGPASSKDSSTAQEQDIDVPPAPSSETALGAASNPVPTVEVVEISQGDEPPAPVYEAKLSDQNFRQVLSRWATVAGWTFAPEHWTVDFDLPLSAEASFGSDFKRAVRELLGATELSPKPLQPCFYSNAVLRVIPMLERCDRTRSQ